MASAFPLEQQAQEQQPATWDPWSGPTKPGFFAGVTDYDPNSQDSDFILPGQRTLQGISARLYEGAAVGVSNLEIALAKHNIEAAQQNQQTPFAKSRTTIDQEATDDAQRMLNSARERIKANTPDAATTGTAAHIIHGLGNVGAQVVPATLVGAPELGIASVAISSYAGRKDELMQQGVDEATANKSALLASGVNTAGVVIPFGLGTSLLMKVGTGAVTNTGLGIANRYADHKILEDAGYKDMAEQIKVMDGNQLITDAVMGGFFGGQAYLHDHMALRAALDKPAVEDAAMTSNLANADRRSSPGVPTTPEAAGVHQAALEKAIEQLSNGEKVDVSNEYRQVLYHASPYDFDQFDFSHIGTGEGNQSYGHGGYFAESDEVGRSYLSIRRPSGIEYSQRPHMMAADLLETYKGDRSAAIAHIENALEDMQKRGGEMPMHDNYKEALDIIKKGTEAPGGILYTVSLPAGHTDRMLDWDRPISEQPHVMEALGVDPNKPSQLPNRVTPDMSGEELYHALSKGKTNLGVNPTPADASRFLEEKGIPGIKYKDQGSRGLGSGTGTRNVVLFSDKDIQITHKNGVPVERPPEFLKRPEPQTKDAATLLRDHLVSGGLLDEEANLRDLEELLAKKRELPERPSKTKQAPTIPPKSGAKVTPAEQKAYVEHAKAGNEVKMNPAESDGHGNLVSKDGESPVFEVVNKIAKDQADAAIQERPGMTIPTERGDVKAADALKLVDEQAKQGEAELPKAIKAATDCFGRKGG